MSHLAGFVADARARVSSGVYHVQGEPLAPNGMFREALDRRSPVIAELKPRSPSEGRLLHEDPRTVLDDLAAGRAAALSILTDTDHFDGSLDLLRLGHETGLPTMMKDFVVDGQQIVSAAHHGASAVLLIERILSPEERDGLTAIAHEHGLEVLLEVFDDDDWATARHSSADMIGVNQRDLDTLDLDVARQRRILGEVRASGLTAIALSGILTRQDRQAAQAAGASAVLVGTSLMRHPYRRLALRAIRRPLVKICGLTTQLDLDAAISEGVDMVGMVVLSDSPRSIALHTARRLASTARAAGVVPVMVTHEPDPDEVFAAAKAISPGLVQWHHQGTDLHGRLHEIGVGLMHGLQPHDPVPAVTDGIVLDAPGGGGTGEVHDWVHAARTVASHRDLLSLIAGGLDASNVQDALTATAAWGADASSRLEARPGHKDAAKMKRFVAAAWA